MFIYCFCYIGVWVLVCGFLGDFGVLGVFYNIISSVRNWMCLVVNYDWGFIIGSVYVFWICKVNVLSKVVFRLIIFGNNEN